MAKKTSRLKASTQALLIGTRKGAFILRSKRGKSDWELSGPLYLGVGINDFMQDPRDPKRFVMCAGGGHLGPTLYSSNNGAKSFKEATRPPRFEEAPKKGPDGTSRGLSVKVNFSLTPGHVSEKGHWYSSSVPQGLFESDDHGDTWHGSPFNTYPKYGDWTRGDAPPNGPFLHSVCVDPRNKQHLQLSLSVGGTFESRDGGKNWSPLNKGVMLDFGPDPNPEFGQDPHCVIQHPANPDLFYQQNHCGIYRLDRARGDTWTRIGKNMPKKIGDIGFGIAGHPSDGNTVWVFPMDGTKVWPRTSPNGQPALYRTSDGGKQWQRLDNGLPKEQAWLTVKRQCLACDGDPRSPALIFGTTSGEVWIGLDGGEKFKSIARHLPEIFSVRPASL